MITQSILFFVCGFVGTQTPKSKMFDAINAISIILYFLIPLLFILQSLPDGRAFSYVILPVRGYSVGVFYETLMKKADLSRERI